VGCCGGDCGGGYGVAGSDHLHGRICAIVSHAIERGVSRFRLRYGDVLLLVRVVSQNALEHLAEGIAAISAPRLLFSATLHRDLPIVIVS
jgi:hypothetical protein